MVDGPRAPCLTTPIPVIPRSACTLSVRQSGYPPHGPSAFCGVSGSGAAVHEDAELTEFWMFMHEGEKHWRMFRWAAGGGAYKQGRRDRQRP